MSTPITITSADERAGNAVLEHHAALSADLEERVAALRTAIRSAHPYEHESSALTAFLTESVLPHAIAEQDVLYAAAAERMTGPFIEAMCLEHRALAERTHALTTASDPYDALSAAEGLAAVFAVHVAKENELLVPALLSDPDAHLADLLTTMHERLSEPALAEQVTRLIAESAPDLDVRTLPHGRERHQAIFARMDKLAPGGRLVIVNNHDPKPLHHQIDAAWPGVFGWEYLQADPDLWRIAITRIP